MDVVRIPIEDLSTFKGRAKHFYKIKSKDGEIIPFEFIEAQKYFDDIVEEEFERTKKEFGASQCRIIACKPRQVGWTTYSNIRSLDMQIQHQGSDGVIAAHDKDTTELIYRIFQRAYDKLPEKAIPTKDGEDLTTGEFIEHSVGKKKYQQYVEQLIDQLGEEETKNRLSSTHEIKVKPDTKSHSGKQMEFVDTDSLTVIFTAGKGDDGGKAGTLKRVHFSEAANYDGYKELLSSIGPSVPKFSDDIFFILESTANGTTGPGEGFYKEWQNSTKEWEKYQTGKIQRFTGFRPVFIPWYMIEEYELPLAGGKFENIDEVDFGTPETKRDFLEREKEMMDKGIYNPLTKEIEIIKPEKINWYRWVIKNDCGYDYRDAQRYYPTTAEEAFVASTNCFFDQMKLNESKTKYLNDGEREYEQGNIEWDDDTGELIFSPDSLGNLKIFEHPEPNWENRYVIGADIAQGYEDGDYSVAYVFDRIKQEYVAYWFGRIDEDIFAEILIELGVYYNEALLIPENNLQTVINIIKPSGLTPYIGEIYFDETKQTIKYGYNTNVATRKPLIDKYKKFLRENKQGYDVIPDVESINEHLSFTRNQTATGVKYEAAEGAHDDRVIGMALCKAGDTWWDIDPEEYKPSKIREILASPAKKTRKYIRNHELGKRFKK